MAQIGVQFDHSTVGTDIASTLAKALAPNVGNAIDIARLKSGLMTDEMERQRLRELTTLATQQAIAQAKENQYKQAIFNAQTDMADPLDAILQAQQRQRQAVAEAPAIVPDTVLQSGAGGRVPEITRGAYYPPAELPPAPPAPEVTTQPSYGQEPDWQYRVNQFPVTSEPPVPVQLPPQDFTGAMPNAPVASMPGLAGQPMLPEAPVPVEPSAQPVVGSGAIVGMGEPLVGAGGPTQPVPLPGFLQNLFGGAPPEQPPAPAGTLGGLQLPTEAPVPVDAGQPPVTAPVINPLAPETPPEPPIVVGGPEVINVPGRPPVSGETTAATAPAAAAPATAEPPTAPPTPAQPAIEEPLPPNKITTKAPGSVGTGTVNADGSSVYQTEQGPVPLTAEQTHKLALAIAYGADPAGQTGKLAGIIKTTFDPSVTLTPNQKAELLSGVSPIGTPEETASKIAIAAAKPEIKEVDKRLYEIVPDGKGGQTAKLIPGQPVADAPNVYGDSEKGHMLNFVDTMLLKGLKNATPEEQRHFVTMVHQLWGSDVKVAADGTVVNVAGDPAPGFPTAGEAFKSGSLPAPAEDTSAAAPATTAPAPAAPAPAPAPAATQPGEPRKNASGRLLTEEGYPSYGGYLVKGEKPPEPVEQELGGRKVQIARPAERTKEAEGQTGKQVSYTRQALEPASYFLKLKKGDVKVTILQDIMTKMADDTPVEKFIQRYALSADEREYFRNVIEIVKDMSHKDSGADVTKSDLVTYRGLYELPLDPTEKDLALLKRSIRSTLRGSREGFVGAVPADSLRAWDKEAGRLGIDLDAQENVAPIGATEETAPPKKGFKVVDGKVVREE